MCVCKEKTTESISNQGEKQAKSFPERKKVREQGSPTFQLFLFWPLIDFKVI